MAVIRKLIRIIGWVFLGLLGWLLFVFVIVRIVRRFYQFPVPPFVTHFIDNPIRRKIQPPAKIIGWMNISPGMDLLEIGPGPGTFTFEASRQVGEQGWVYAIDIQDPVLRALKLKVQQREITNINLNHASAYQLPFPDRKFDRIYLVTVLGEIPDKQRALVEFRRVLKDHGRLAVGEFLPDPDYPRQSTVRAWCRNSGYELTETHGNILHYLQLFKKS